MGMQVDYGTIEQRQMKQLARNSVKIGAKLDLRVPAKKVLSAVSRCFLGGMESGEGECKVSGKVITRVIYIDEFDAFNSEERTDNFTEKLIYKGQGTVTAVSPSAVVLDTHCDGAAAGTQIDVDSVVEISLIGLVHGEVKYASGISGGAEARLEKTMAVTFSRLIDEKFETSDRLELDKNCSGVLGVDVYAYIRDIDCNENRVTVKGCVSVNVIGVKNGETNVIYNSPQEFDFSKSMNLQGVGIDDTVIGSVAVAGVTVKAENKTKPELAVDVELCFSGVCITGREIEYVSDALSFDNHIGLTQAGFENTVVQPQSNLVVDIESNMTMPNAAPYISKILAVGGGHITGINIVPTDGKVNIEGVLKTDVVYECEEKQVHTHEAQVAFTASARIEGVAAGHAVQVTVQPINCHIKARRGKELLVDAKLGISIASVSTKTAQITGNIVLGETKARDDSAIMIYIVNDKETLWDIAKRISICQAEIIKQNPQCANGVNAGDKLFIYWQNVINF